MSSVNIAICGAGSLGSQIAHHLAHKGVKFFILDDDVVEVQNIRVSVYSSKHLARKKADVLAEICMDRGAEAIPINGTVKSVEHLQTLDVDLIIDAFDNPETREITTQVQGIPIVHVGVGTENNGIVFWGEDYVLPPKDSDLWFSRGKNPVCTNALGAPILRRTSLRAAELVENWLSNGVEYSDLVSLEGEM